MLCKLGPRQFRINQNIEAYIKIETLLKWSAFRPSGRVTF